MTVKRLNEALGKIKGLVMLEEMDPNVERSSTTTRRAMDALFCNTVMQKEFSKEKRQTTMLQFFKKTPVEDVLPEEDVDDPVKAVETEEAQVDDDVLDSEVDSGGECFNVCPGCGEALVLHQSLLQSWCTNQQEDHYQWVAMKGGALPVFAQHHTPTQTWGVPCITGHAGQRFSCNLVDVLKLVSGGKWHRIEK
ncbi:hypothetical protein E2C01_008435 [Portunus trituberculatus]|uniref:Uncharacterized protein n=1 Tax=Portunus trituberculatus TaxID=210409 RepID=A0A5B7D4M0_PORTR|nr:hypothetical protein [Portunus trituberculatus]